MDTNFSPRVKDVISFSREEALRLGHDYIGTEHFLLGMIREGEGVAIKILENLEVDLTELRKLIENSVKSVEKVSKPQNSLGNIPLVKQAEKTLKITYLEAKLFKSNIIGTEHLLLSILKDENNVASRALSAFSVTYELVKSELETMQTQDSPRAEYPDTPRDDEDDDGPTYSGGGGSQGTSSGGSGSRKPTDSKSKTPVLDNFGRDLTKLAEDGKLDPIVGREKEIERVSQI